MEETSNYIAWDLKTLSMTEVKELDSYWGDFWYNQDPFWVKGPTARYIDRERKREREREREREKERERERQTIIEFC